MKPPVDLSVTFTSHSLQLQNYKNKLSMDCDLKYDLSHKSSLVSRNRNVSFMSFFTYCDITREICHIQRNLWAAYLVIDAINSFHPESRLSQQLFRLVLSALSAHSTPGKAVDLIHIALNDLPFNFHTKVWSILQQWVNSEKQTTFRISRENKRHLYRMSQSW